ncbi:MAG: FAD-binding oxidoreductase [Rhodobacteraceae bacterium]|nr:FAD-binding oxidoreductase [Paracoccaceae bacterium]
MYFMPASGVIDGGRPMLNSASPGFINKLRAAIRPDIARAATQADIEEPRGLFLGQAAAVLRPRTTFEVSSILTLCNQALVPVVPVGGGTGLVGGQVMPEGPVPVLISLESMTGIRDISIENNTMNVEAGAILADIHSAAEAAGRMFPLRLASEGSCRIGGNLATNAGGVNVLRYGNTRDLCLGLEAVLADGTVIGGMKRLRKDNTGYDMRHLMIGSEGTLGVITGAVLRLFPRPRARHTAFVAVPEPKAALALLLLLQDRLAGVITGFELIGKTGFDFLEETGFLLPSPLAGAGEWSVLIELEGGEELAQMLEAGLSEAMESRLVSDAVIAQNESQRQHFWNIRETIPQANKRIGSISSHDISVPVSEVPAFIQEARKQIPPIFRVNCFGHMGDGNLHYNIFPPKGKNRADYSSRRESLARIVFDIVAGFGGSFSAEHGIGRLKTADLARYGDAGKILAMQRIKTALDPNGILNPGAVLPTG